MLDGAMTSPTIRDAAQADAEAIAGIYAHHVLNGTASFDFDPPGVEFHRDKIGAVAAAGWPYLVAEVDGEVVGYAYATQIRDRPGYRFTGEDSIYVHPERTGRGVGKLLLQALIERSTEAGFRTMIAVIGGGEPASIAVHRACGFAEAGRLRSVGFKFGRWLDSVYMQRDLGPGPG
jgi:phosphinothricin acetyltransferase